TGEPPVLKCESPPYRTREVEVDKKRERSWRLTGETLEAFRECPSGAGVNHYEVVNWAFKMSSKKRQYSPAVTSLVQVE
ncbi:hypothetical protein HAX54_011762, partial [Datura stramonium]|nr:hypothetical protein [Datura stramonium]